MYDFFRSRKFTVRLSELIKFVTERSDIREFSVNGCRSFPSFKQERQILTMKTGTRPRRMKSNRPAKPIENNGYRYTDSIFTDRDITPLEPIPLGIYLEKKGEILGMLTERMDKSQVASMLLSGAMSSTYLGPGKMTKKKKSNKRSKRRKPKKS